MPQELKDNIERTSTLFIGGSKFDFSEEADASQLSENLIGKKRNSPLVATLATNN